MSPAASQTKPPGQTTPSDRAKGQGQPRPRSRISDATIQLELRRRRRRRSRIVRWVVVLVFVAVLVTGGWLAGFSSVLAIRQVEVSGTRMLSPVAVEQAAQVPIGRPMLRTDLRQLTERTQTLAPVESAEVTRVWPKTIRITVRERAAVYALSQAGTGAELDYLLVDRHGVGYTSVAQPPKGLLVASVRTTDSSVLKDIAVVVAALPVALRQRVDQISAASPDTIELALDNGAVLRWGSADQSRLKAKVAVALLHRKARVYDVTAPGQPATR